MKPEPNHSPDPAPGAVHCDVGQNENTMLISDIEKLEECLRRAMLAGNVAELDRLISNRLLFVTPDGVKIDKQGDLEAHRSGFIRVSALTAHERHIEAFGSMAIVNVAMEMVGSFAGTPFAGRFRFTRVWYQEEGQVRVVAGHACAIK
jgi:hypothetical protein